MKEKNSLTHSMKDKNSESENTKLSHSMLEKKLQSPIKDIGVDEEEKIIEVKEWEKESDT